MYDLVEWHRRLHGVTGSIAVLFLQVTPNDLTSWAQELHAIAAAMASAARGTAPAEKDTATPAADEPMPEA
jgi:hypothetical protein